MTMMMVWVHQQVAALHEALRDPNTQPEALEIMRSLIEQVIAHPRKGGGFEITRRQDRVALSR